MIRLMMLILGLATSVPATASVKQCLNLFSFKTLDEKFIYASIHNSQKNFPITTQPNSATIAVGRAVLVGKEADVQTREVATLDYRIKDGFLTITSARVPSELTGQGIFRQLLEKVLADNPNVNTIMTSLTGKFYEEYRLNLEFVRNTFEALPPTKSETDVAIELGSVFGELNKLGFSQIRSSTVLETFSGPFVRFSVTR